MEREILNKNILKFFAFFTILVLPLMFSPSVLSHAERIDITYPIRVLFDQSHGQPYTSQNFGSFINALESKLGFSIDVNTDDLTTNVLENYDIVIIPIPGKNFTTEEINAINTFMFNWSRSLLLLGDSLQNVSYLNSLTSSIGFEFTNGTVYRLNSSEVQVTDDMFQKDSLTHDVESLTYIGCGLRVLSESSIDFYNYIVVWGDKNTFLDLNENTRLDADEPFSENVTMIIGTELYSGGRIIAIGSTQMFSDNYWSSYSNAIFAINIMKWLAKFPQPYFKEAYISWIISCQWLSDPNKTTRYGGFATDPESDIVTMLPTYAAIRFLNDTNSLDRIINKTAIVEFVRKSQYLTNSSDDKYNGFGGYPGDTDVKCGYTGMAIYILKVLNRLDAVNLTAVIHFLSSHQKTDATDVRNYGGFSKALTTNATIEETYWAIYGLHLVDSLPNINVTACIQWVVASQYLENSTHVNYGAFLSYPGRAPHGTFIVYSYFAVSTLKLLNGLDEIKDKDILISWVKKLYNSSVELPEYFGGFFDRLGGSVRASATYMAVDILATFNELFNHTASIDYLSKCQNLDGGFSDGVTVNAIASTLGGYYGVMGDPSVSVRGMEQLKLRLTAVVSIPKKIYSGDQISINVKVTGLQDVGISDLMVKVYINNVLIKTKMTNESGLCATIWTAEASGEYVLYVYVSGSKYYNDIAIKGAFEVTGQFNVDVEGLPGAVFTGEEANITVIVKDNFSGNPVEDANVIITLASKNYTLQSIGGGYYRGNITTKGLVGELGVKVIVEREYYESWERTYTLIVYPRPLALWIYLLIFVIIVVTGGILFYVRRRRRRESSLILPTSEMTRNPNLII